MSAYQRLFTIVCCCLCLCFGLASTALAQSSLILNATVPASPSHFQLELSGPADGSPFNSGSTVYYTLTYGSYLPYPTDMIVLEVSWSLGQIQGGGTANILEYASATNGLGGASPVIDAPNRKITWTITPVPPGDNHQVNLGLFLQPNYTGAHVVDLDVSARLIGPGVELPTQTRSLQYHYVPPPPTPTPTPTVTASPSSSITPTPTETASPSATLVPPVGQITPTPPSTKPPTPTKPPGAGFLDTINIDEIIPEITEQAEEVAEHGGAAVAAPVAALFLLGPAINLLLQLAPYLSWWQLPGLIGALFFNRKRRSWGVVYDSVTKLPLDPVLVTLTDAKGKTYQSVTDLYGRYQFLVVPGRYHLKAQKTNYHFPSTVMVDQNDPIYEDVYLGQEIVIDDASNINVNIPMDQIQPDWNEQAKAEFGLTRRPHLNWHWRGYIFAAGFTWCLVMAAISPNPINIAMVGFYVALAVGVSWYRHRHPWGVIEEAHHPLANAVVTIEDLHHPRLKFPPVVTNTTGRYAFLVAGGDYQVKVALPQGQHQFSEYLNGPTIHVHGQYGAIHQDLQVDDARPAQLG